MNIYIFKPIIVNLRDKYFDFKVFISFRIRFFISKINTFLRVKSKFKNIIYKDIYIHICNQHNKYNKNWESHKVNRPLSFKYINKYSDTNNFISFIRLIVPKGIHKIKEITINYKLKNTNLNSNNYQKFILKKRDIKDFQNLKYLDFSIKSRLTELNICSKDIPITAQEITIKKSLKKNNLIFIVLDAANFDNLEKSHAYKKFISKRKHLLAKTYSPSSLTISSLPSLMTLQPVIHHLIGKLGPFYKSYIDQIPQSTKTIPEILSEYIDYSVGFTTFAKTTNSRSFNKGFTSYYYRTYERNYSPSSLDNFLMYFKENEDIFNSINSFFGFIHDSGAHPGLHPYLPLEKNKLNNSDFSYDYTYNLSLNKVSALLDHLEMFDKLEDTNLIITGDHTKTENKNFNIFQNNLLPGRVEVPVLFIPSANLSSENFDFLKKEFSYLQPSVNLIPKIINKIYQIKLITPSYSFGDFNWLSSQYDYPKMERIYILCFAKKINTFLTVTLKTKYLFQKISYSKLSDLEIFKIVNNKPEPLKSNDSIHKEVKKSLIDYIRNCRKNAPDLVKQKDIDFY